MVFSENMKLTEIALLRMHRSEGKARRMHAVLDIERSPEGVRRSRLPVQDMHGRLRVQDIRRPSGMYHKEMSSYVQHTASRRSALDLGILHSMYIYNVQPESSL